MHLKVYVVNVFILNIYSFKEKKVLDVFKNIEGQRVAALMPKIAIYLIFDLNYGVMKSRLLRLAS